VSTILWTSKADYARHERAVGQLHRTDDAGNLAIPVRLDGRQRAAVSRNGDWLNMSLVAFDAAGRPISHVTTSRYLGSRPDGRAGAASVAHAGTVQLTGEGRMAPAVGGTARAVDNARVAALAACTYYWEPASYALRYAQVGELHVDFDVPYARFTYGKSADTTFDVVAQTGSSGWTLVGSVHVGNSLSATVFANAGGQANYHWALRTQFRFVNMRIYKDCLGGPYHAWTGTEEWDALEWTGVGMTLANTLTQPARKSANTSIFGARTGWSRSNSALTKWAAAVSVFGANMGAQSGASSFVRIEYEFGGRQAHYLYGDNAPPGTSRRVFQDTP
jgi:hypothetical protein